MNKLNKKMVSYVNARLLDPSQGFDALGGVLTSGKIIIEAKPNLFNNEPIPEESEIIDCKGAVIAPGLVDMRAHLREPGEEYKETLSSASNAAAAGGITSIVCMPNTKPVIDQISVVEFIARRARETSAVKIFPCASISMGIEGKKLTEMGMLKEAGVIAFSDAHKPLSNSLLMSRALKYSNTHGTLIIQHPEDKELALGGVMNNGPLATRLGLPGIPREAEIIQVQRDIKLLEMSGGKLHFSHVSTSDSIEAIALAQNKGLEVSCSTAPHYFTLNENEIGEWRTFAKVSPPLRSENDRLAIVKGIEDGVISCIASDHAPHDSDSKRLPFEQASPGIIGLESLLPLSLKLCNENNKISLSELIASLTINPSKLLHLPSGTLSKNAPADLVIFDPDIPVTLSAENMLSKSKNAPYDNFPAFGKVLRTVIDGRTIYKSN